MNTFFKLDNYVILDLFEIQLESFEGYLRFHGSKNFSKNISFQNQEYIFIPCELSNLESSSDGRQPKPTLKIANINNYMSYVLKDRGDLIGKSFIRKKILARDLDVSNFSDGINPFGVSNFKTYISYDQFLINLKKSENKEFIELELATKIDIQNINIPSRKVTNDTCSWGYRCYGCNYGNTADYSGPVTTNTTQVSSLANSIGQMVGMAIADENDKVFLANYKTSLSNENYGLSSINYSGKWTDTSTYNKGDSVYLDFIPNITTNLKTESISSFNNKPNLFYVCVEDGVFNKQPDLNTDIWKQDQCSKTLKGCLLRFEDYVLKKGEDGKSLPFGGFPSTFSHDNKR